MIDFVLTCGALVYQMYVVLLFFSPTSEVSKRIRAELWWVVDHVCVPMQLLYMLRELVREVRHHAWGWIVWDVLVILVTFFVWIIIHNDKDKDDRWKKRRKKLAARVKQMGGKLVVVPIPVTR